MVGVWLRAGDWAEVAFELFRDGRPVGVMPESDHLPAPVEQPILGVLITFGYCWMDVDGPIDEDRDVDAWQAIHEVGPSQCLGYEDLRIVRQAQAMFLEPCDELSFQGGVRLRHQTRELFRARFTLAGCACLGCREA